MNPFLGGIQMGFGLADAAARRKLAEESSLAMRDYRKQMGQYYDEQAESNRMLRKAQADKLAREAVQEMERQQWIGQKWQELNPEGLETGALPPDVAQSRFDRLIMEGIGTGRLPAQDYMPYIRSRTEADARKIAKETENVPLKVPQVVDVNGVKVLWNPNTGSGVQVREPRADTKTTGLTEAQKTAALLRIAGMENRLMQESLAAKKPEEKRNLRAQMDNLQKERERIEQGGDIAGPAIETQKPDVSAVSEPAKSVNVDEERAVVNDMIKRRPELAERYKKLFKNRTGVDF